MSIVFVKVNAVTGTLFSAEVMEKIAQKAENADQNKEESEAVCVGLL